MIEWMVIFRREVLERTGGFDETLGVGAATPWQSCEIQDIILRAMELGYRCRYDPSVAGHHPDVMTPSPDARLRRKGRAYARGMGYTLRLHGYSAATRGFWVARPIAGIAVMLAKGRPAMARYYAQVALGRAEGAVGRTVGR
jgi:hypothetical protein